MRYRNWGMLESAGTDWLAGCYCNQFQITSPNPSGATCTSRYYWPTDTINPPECAINT